MLKLSIVQKYMICAVNEKGKISTLKTERVACLVAAGLLELQIEGYIEIEGKVVNIVNPLPEEKNYLRPLYDFIEKKKNVKVNKIAEAYAVSFSDTRFNELVTAIGDSLVNNKVAEKVQTGLIRIRSNYIPINGIVDSIIDTLKLEFLENGEVTEENAVIVILLEKSKCLKNYFSNAEQKKMKEKLQNVMTSPNGKLVKNMVEHVENLIRLYCITAIS